MKAVVAVLSLVAPLAAVATPVLAQQDPAERARIEELTRRLNGAPPAPQRPSPPERDQPDRPSVAPRQDPAERARIEELTRRLNGAPAPTTPALTTPAPAAPASAPPSSPAPAPRPQAQPAGPVPQPAPAAAPQPQAASPARPAPASGAPLRRTAPAATPAPQGLNADAQAALPFRIDLPPGFELVEGRAAPGARVYSARRAGKTYLMIYAGPSSQFPIYDGDHVTVGGRVSVVTTYGQRRVAMEHLFQRSVEPAEIHVWLMAQDGPDRDEAERIAQTVDPR
ncbi:MAG: hypothetical protein J0I52_04300 [Bordetella sp.]|nr:hypothetical protein [Bordetella sp.]